MTLKSKFNPFEPDLQALAWVDTAATADAVRGTGHGPAKQVRGAVIGNRDVRGGELFITMPSLHVHGAKFTPDAISRRAKAMLTDAAGLDLAANPEVSVITTPDVPHAADRTAAMARGNPADHLRSQGVTGTNGKATTTYLLRHLLRHVGKLTASVGTVEVTIGECSVLSNITTPRAAQVQVIAASTVAAHLEDLVLEVSFHALGLRRTDPLRFRVADFCNLTHDHLDFHHSMEDYFQAKTSLFTERHSDRQVIIVDDDWGRRLAEQLERTEQYDSVTLSTTGSPADQQASITPDTSDYSHLDLRAFGGKTTNVQIPMPGRFNTVDTTLAVVMLATGLSASSRMLNGDILRHPCSYPIRAEIPRHMELIANQPRVIVDLAYNPGVSESLLETLRPSTAGRLRLVSRETGQRDLEKRPVLGRIAGELADFTYLTDDDPYEEDPSKIRTEICTELKDSPDRYIEIAGRSAAIEQATRDAKPQDAVVIAGRDHEILQETLVGAIDLDDRVGARVASQLRD